MVDIIVYPNNTEIQMYNNHYFTYINIAITVTYKNNEKNLYTHKE